MRFLVIPCFNEEQRLVSGEVSKCIEVLKCTVVLVDDGSTDRTLEKLSKLALDFPESIEVLPLPRNVGKGEAVRAGFNYAFERGATRARAGRSARERAGREGLLDQEAVARRASRRAAPDHGAQSLVGLRGVARALRGVA